MRDTEWRETRALVMGGHKGSIDDLVGRPEQVISIVPVSLVGLVTHRGLIDD